MSAIRRARVPLLAAIAIGVSILAVWRGLQRAPAPATAPNPASSAPGPEARQEAPSSQRPPATEAEVEAEREAMEKFIAGLEDMLEERDPDQAQRGAASVDDAQDEPMPLPLPEHLRDASKEEQHAYYVELLRHGESMIELNRENVPPEDLAEAEGVMAKLRERLAGMGDAGTPQ